MTFGRLDVFWPDGRIQTFNLEGDTVSIGRAPGNTIALETDTISRYHCSITHQNGDVHITDLDSANGTYIDGTQLHSNDPFLLATVEEIQIGHLRLIYHPVDDSPTLPIAPLDDSTQPVVEPGFRVGLETGRIPVWPASSSSVELSITNTGDDEAQFDITLSGLPQGWARVNRPILIIDVGETAYVLVNVKPTRAVETIPGDYHLTIEVNRSQEGLLDSDAAIDLTVEVKPFSGFGMALNPTELESGDSMRLFLLNQGTEELPISIHGKSLDNALEFDFPDAPVNLTAGQRLQINGIVKAKNPPLVGNIKQHHFDILAKSHNAVGFTAATRGKVTVNPRIPTWMAISGVGILIAIVLIGFVLALNNPTPEIESFSIQSTQVAQGNAIVLYMEGSNVSDYDVYINDQLALEDIAGDSTDIPIDTTNLIGELDIRLEANNGSLLDSASGNVLVYQPLILTSFTVEPAQMARNSVGELELSWDISGATITRLIIPESFTNAPISPTYPSQGSTSFVGLPEDTFIVGIYAEDQVGNTLEDLYADFEGDPPYSIIVEVFDPACTPTDTVNLHEGPGEVYPQVGTAPIDVPVIVSSRSPNSEWLRMELPSGIIGWGPISAFDCAFVIEDLQTALDIPEPPPPTPTPVPTETPLIPSATPIPTDLPTAMPTLTPTANN